MYMDVVQVKDVNVISKYDHFQLLKMKKITGLMLIQFAEAYKNLC